MGNPNWVQGVSGNPNGRPKGARSRNQGDLLDRIVDVWNALENDDSTKLETLAKENPQWFYKHFLSKMIPRNIDIGLFAGRSSDHNTITDADLIGIIRNGNGNGKQPPEPKLKRAGNGSTRSHKK